MARPLLNAHAEDPSEVIPVNKLNVVRWCSVIMMGALAIGCGNRADNKADKPQAANPSPCVPPPVATVAPSSTPTVTVAPVAPPQTVEPKKAEKPADKKVEKPIVTNAPLKVRRLVVAEGVDRSKREPIKPGTSFKVSEADKLFAFIEVDNPEKAESEVLVTFEPNDKRAAQGQIALNVGASPRWRTWAFSRQIKKAGSWTAVVRAKDGTVLARAPFEVTL